MPTLFSLSTGAAVTHAKRLGPSATPRSTCHTAPLPSLHKCVPTDEVCKRIGRAQGRAAKPAAKRARKSRDTAKGKIKQSRDSTAARTRTLGSDIRWLHRSWRGEYTSGKEPLENGEYIRIGPKMYGVLASESPGWLEREAFSVLNLTHHILNRRLPASDQINEEKLFRRRAHRLLNILADFLKILPEELAIDGVMLLSDRPVKYGGFADIYHGKHTNSAGEEVEVALKVLKIFQDQSDEARHILRQKFAREALVDLVAVSLRNVVHFPKSISFFVIN
ncbi:hypothetical protein B0H14DRAFT_2584796 [Mycena olivaceomarginata]|nr:hypothetical protein B0H14DRAFT_2584796 [Mycena olivaceomarginata]